jgi:hypothetical protein
MFTRRYLGETIEGMSPPAKATLEEEPKFTREQELLKAVRDTYCDKVNAKLAEAIGIQPSYANRLFYPIGKKGRKGIGLSVMRACTAKFKLAPGYWEGADKQSFAATIRSENEMDPYKLIEQGLRALVIVGHAKDEVMKQIRQFAQISEETQNAMKERIYSSPRDKKAKQQ